MITEEHKIEKICVFCTNEYHLEMILLPYIKTRLESSEFIIFTETDLDESLDILLTKVNFNQETNKKIKNIGWKKENKTDFLKKYIEDNKEVSVIINGKLNYIEKINDEIKGIINEKTKIIDCFHIDEDINIKKISSQYKYVLNTQRI